MSPEATLIAVNLAFLALAYLWVYPSLSVKTMSVIAKYDLATTGAALLSAGLLFAGQGLRFSLIVIEVPWWAFAVLTLFAMELPLTEWFRRKHGLNWRGADDEAG